MYDSFYEPWANDVAISPYYTVGHMMLIDFDFYYSTTSTSKVCIIIRKPAYRSGALGQPIASAISHGLLT